MVGDQHIEISAQVVQKLGFYMFVVMTSLMVICIAFGFYAVIQKFNEPNWKEVYRKRRCASTIRKVLLRLQKDVTKRNIICLQDL